MYALRFARFVGRLTRNVLRVSFICKQKAVYRCGKKVPETVNEKSKGKSKGKRKETKNYKKASNIALHNNTQSMRVPFLCKLGLF